MSIFIFTRPWGSGFQDLGLESLLAALFVSLVGSLPFCQHIHCPKNDTFILSYTHLFLQIQRLQHVMIIWTNWSFIQFSNILRNISIIVSSWSIQIMLWSPAAIHRETAIEHLKNIWTTSSSHIKHEEHLIAIRTLLHVKVVFVDKYELHTCHKKLVILTQY